MVAIPKICLTALLANSVFAAPAPGPLVKFGELKQVPAYWATTGPADSSTLIKARIGIKQRNIKGLQQKLMDVADPKSPNYGKWLSKEQVKEFSAPSDSDVAAVRAWLAQAGISDATQSNDWIEFTAPVSKMDSLLDAKYEWFTHVETGLKIPRTQKYSVPKNLHALIDVITPTTALYHNLGPHAAEKGAIAKRDNTYATPSFIRSTYNVDYNSTGSQTIATTGFQNVGASHSDYASFAQQYAPSLADFTDVSVNGGSNSGDGSAGEGNLDTQYAGALASPNPSEFLAVGPYEFEDALVAFSEYLNSANSPPSVVSSSYGDTESNFDSSYLDRICNEFMKASSLGISILFSSGDSGVGGNKQPSCSNGFYALFPASCPYITSIGGTEITNGEEIVADFGRYNNKVTSAGGGYSRYFPAPDYNANVTAAYAQSLDQNTQQQFNANNRGYPDLSLISELFPTEINGAGAELLGTSASSPSVAGLFSVLNDYRQSQSKPVLGFLNPLLYSGKVDSAIRDVTEGNNYGCDSNGFYAAPGWDAASGLGSFDFSKFRSLI